MCEHLNGINMDDRSAIKICRNILIFFAIFGIINSLELPALRVRIPLKAANKIDLIRTVIKYEDIKHDIVNRYQNQELRLNASSMKSFHEFWNWSLYYLWHLFIEAVHNHLVKKLRDYCSIILKLIKIQMDSSSSEELTILEIKNYAFPTNINFYHIISILHTYVNYIPDILDLVYFFQFWPLAFQCNHSKNPNTKISYTMQDTSDQVTSLMDHLRFMNPNENEKNTLNLENEDTDMLFEKLKTIRREIETFTAFFLVVQPILDKRMFIPMSAANIFKKLSPFIMNMMKNESCYIQFYESGTFNTQAKTYANWNCSEILYTDEYGKSEYLPISKFCETIKSVGKPFKGFITDLLPKKKTKPVETDVELLTLLELHNFILAQSFYLNALQFNNVLADAIIYTAIKEGTKPLKGILKEMTIACENKLKTTLSVEKIMIMRGSLLMVKLYFEDLKKDLIKYYPTILSTPERKTYIRNFQIAVSQILGYLDYKSLNIIDYLRDYCVSIRYKLSNIMQAKRSGTILEFDQYYFFLPPTYLYDILAFVQSLINLP